MKKLFVIILLSFCCLLTARGQLIFGQGRNIPFLGNFASDPPCSRVGRVYFNTTTQTYKSCKTVGTPGVWINLEGSGDSAIYSPSKLLGRGSASGSGVGQEITVGSGLSLIGTTLSATGGGGGFDGYEQLLPSETLAQAITRIGATPAQLFLKADANCSTAITVPANIVIISPRGAKITKQAGCTLVFQGIGLADPTSQMPIFANFAAGEVTFTGATKPKQLSSELWDTGNNSATDRLKCANQAIPAADFVEIIAYPRVIDSQVRFRTNRRVFFMPGDYTNNFNGFYIAALLLNTNVHFDGSWAARFLENSGAGHRLIEGPHDINDLHNPYIKYENASVRNLAFIGNDAGTASSAGSKIQLYNAHNTIVENCLFYRTHEYTVTFGGFGDQGNYSDGVEVRNNKFIGIGTQVVAPLNAKNFKISGNHFDQKNANSTPTYTVIDLEPNASFDRLENGIIENNIMDMRDVQNTRNSVAILVQGTDHRINKNITIRNNTIYGSNLIASDGPDETAEGTGGTMLIPIAVYNTSEFYIYGNTIRGGAWSGIIAGYSRDGRIYNNDIILAGSQFGSWGVKDQIRLLSCVSTDVSDNRVSKTTMASMGGYNDQRAGIHEHDGHLPATVNGTNVTIQFFENGNSNAYRVQEHLRDFNVVINTQTYYVTSTVSPATMTLSTSAGVIPQSSYTVNASTDVLTADNHGFVTGGKAYLVNSGGAFPTENPARSPATEPGWAIDEKYIYYVIRIDNNTLKLAKTLALAQAGTAIDFTDAGTGTNKIAPYVHFTVSSNTYSNNKAEDGVVLSNFGTSQIVSTYEDNQITTVTNGDSSYVLPRAAGITVFTQTAQPRTVPIPSAIGLKGKEYVVKDGSGGAATNAITLAPPAGQTIDGAATYPLNTNYGKVKIKSNGANWIVL